jgi:hypothetical protein
MLLPQSIRAIISGPSGSGKTNLMLSLIFNENGLRFENIYIFSKSLYQPKYDFLKEICNNLPEIGLYCYSQNEDITDVKRNSVFIFDDVACDKQDKIRSYFCMGRHSDVDSFYLTQTYARIPKHLVRDNANVIILFKQDEMNIRHVYNDHVNGDMKFEQFKNMCREVWSDGKHCPMVIVKDCDIQDGRYRIGFDKFIHLH